MDKPARRRLYLARSPSIEDSVAQRWAYGVTDSVSRAPCGRNGDFGRYASAAGENSAYMPDNFELPGISVGGL